MTLPESGQAARLARQATREILASWRCEHLEEAAVLLVSELVANVVRHAQTTAMMLRLGTAGSCLRIEVHDTDPRQPRPRKPAGLDESGFGFVLVDALADKWGVLEIPPGKAIWAELDIHYRGETGISAELPGSL